MAPNVTELSQRLEVFRERTGVPAVAAAMLHGAGEPTVEVCGVRVRGSEHFATVEDFWHIGSCAKSITAALAAQFVEGGRLSWDTTLPALFPSLEVHPFWDQMTLANVLHHRSGLRANLKRSEGRAALVDSRPVADQRTELVSRLLASPGGKVGRFRYTNLGYSLVGAALERLGEMPYERLVFEELLTRVGVDDGGFGPPTGLHPWGHIGRFAGLRRGPAIAPGDNTLPRPADNPQVINPAGRLHLRLRDWANFIRVFLEPNPGFFADETIERLTTPTAGRGTNQAMGWGVAKLPGVSIGQQGSNRRWVATALLSDDRTRAALVVTNDGRAQMLRHTAMLAAELLSTQDKGN